MDGGPWDDALTAAHTDFLPYLIAFRRTLLTLSQINKKYPQITPALTLLWRIECGVFKIIFQPSFSVPLNHSQAQLGKPEAGAIPQLSSQVQEVSSSQGLATCSSPSDHGGENGSSRRWSGQP